LGTCRQYLADLRERGTKTITQKERTVAQKDLPALGETPEDRGHNFYERHPDGWRRPVRPPPGSPFGSHAMDMFSKIVGRTGFEPVTSSVSGNSRAAPGVWHRRTESNAEPLACDKILTGSRWVRGWLNTLAPILAPTAFGALGTAQGAKIIEGCP
jgi:hypothetical protein